MAAKKFKVIVADPPWSFDDKLQSMKAKTKRSAVSQYKELSNNEIKNLDIRSVVDPSGCVLVLWVPSTLLDVGLDVAKSWGFKLKQTYVWVKIKKDASKEKNINNITRIGMGRLFRQAHEIALVCTSGKSVYKDLQDKSQRSVCLAQNKGHSIKPDVLQHSLDSMFPGVEKLEVFARRNFKGWTCIGDAIDGLDIRDAILQLTKEEETDESQ